MRSTLFLFLYVYMCCSDPARAQNISYNNSIRTNLNLLFLGGGNSTSTQYAIGYRRDILYNKRISLELSPGYVYASDYRNKRYISGDITVSFDLLSNVNKRLNIGIGPTLWYGIGSSTNRDIYVVEPNGSISIIASVHEQKEDNIAGYHLTSEYEIDIASRVTVCGRLGLLSLNGHSRLIPFLGLCMGYEF